MHSTICITAEKGNYFAHLIRLTIITISSIFKSMKFVNQYKNLPRQIYFLSLSRMITEMGMMFVFPFMTLLLTQRLDFTAIQAGYFMVFTSFGNMAGSLLGGKLADEYGRKIVYSFLTFLILVSMVLAGFTCHHRIVILFVFLSYASISAMMPVVSAMIADKTRYDQRSESFSLLYLSGNIGCALGPIIAGLLFYRHMPWIFYSQALFFFGAFLLIRFTIRDDYIPNRLRNKKEERSQTHSESLASVTLHRPVLLGFLILLLILTACYIECDYLLPLQLNEVYGLNRGSKLSSLVWTLNGLAVLFFTPAIISISKKYHPLFSMIFVGVFFACGYVLYSLGMNYLIFIVSPLIWTVGEILLTTYSGVFIAAQSPETHKSRCMSLYEFFRGIGKCIGPWAFGYLITLHDFSFCWGLVTAICMVCSILMFLLYYMANVR